MFSPHFVNLLADNGPSVTDLGLAMQRAALAMARDGVSGGVVWYIGHSCEIRGEHEVLPNVVLEFAPGAVVTLAPAARLTVPGEVLLTIGQHFELGADAAVQLLGPLEGVRPEWFGSGEAGADEALAAVYQLVLDRVEHGAPSAPILLSRSYPLNRPWVLSAGRVTAGIEVTVLGRHPVGDAVVHPTLWCGPAAEVSTALDVRPGVTLRMRNVALRREVGFVSPNASLLTLDGDNGDTTLERCSFFVGAGIGLDSRRDGGVPSERLIINECWFESIAFDGLGVALVQIHAADAVARVDVDGCTFVGAATAMIAMRSGSLFVSDTLFANSFAEGVDLAMGALSGLKPAPTVSSSVDLVETHVRSESENHLRGDLSGTGRDHLVSITGLCHDPAVARVGEVPTSVAWRGGAGSGILLQGCNLGGDIVMQNSGSPVVALATQFRVPVRSDTVVRGARTPVWMNR